MGIITRDQSLLAQPPKIERIDPPRLAPHFVDAVVARNPELRGTVRTTLDLDLQTTIERLVRSHLSALNRHDITQAAVVVIENGIARFRKVTVARDLGTEVELRDGIKAGDEVILRPMVNLADGSKVQAAPIEKSAK